MPYGTKIDYKGYTLRSKHEFAWARFFDVEGLRWCYEPVKFRDPGAPEAGLGYSYTPDFGLDENTLFVEIKPTNALGENRFHFCTKPLLIAVGMPDKRPHFYLSQRSGLYPLRGIPWSTAYQIARSGFPSWMGDRSCFNPS